jgi:hypothetical protein
VIAELDGNPGPAARLSPEQAALLIDAVMKEGEEKMLQRTLRVTERTLVLAALLGTRFVWRGLVQIAKRPQL